MSARDLIFKIFHQVRKDKDLPPMEIRGGSNLEHDLGLDSLDMATVVAELEQQLGLDPFANDTPEFQTVDQFVKLYGP